MLPAKTSRSTQLWARIAWDLINVQFCLMSGTWWFNADAKKRLGDILSTIRENQYMEFRDYIIYWLLPQNNPVTGPSHKFKRVSRSVVNPHCHCIESEWKYVYCSHCKYYTITACTIDKLYDTWRKEKSKFGLNFVIPVPNPCPCTSWQSRYRVANQL